MVLLGQYLPRETPLERLDPRIKIMAVMTLSMAVLHADGCQMLLLSAFLAALTGVARIAPGYLARSLGPVIPFFALLFFMHLFLTDGTPLFPSFPLPLGITVEGAWQGAVVVWQFASLVVAGSLLTMTTSPSGLVGGIERLLRPLGRFGLPSSGIALMVSMALRFLPMVLEEYEQIRTAQLSRGADFSTGSPVRRLRAVAALAMPLLLASFRRADALIMAMESRGYHNGPRTSLQELKLSPVDGVALSILALVMAVDIGLGTSLF